MAFSPRLSKVSSSLSMSPDDRQTDDVEHGEQTVATESRVSFRSMTRNEKATIVSFCTTNLGVGCFYSLLSPFFPTEAVKKGINTTVVGAIIGVFELVVVLMSPIYGKYLTRIGAKFMYISGVMVCGAGTVLFGFVDGSPDGVPYAVICILVRIVEALGSAALVTSSFAIIANTFPNNVTAMFGSLEMFIGLGLMIGPPLGGALFEAGGFKFPFVSLGSAIFLVGFASAFILPSQNVARTQSDNSMFALLKLPIVSIMGLCLMSGAASITFIDTTLSLYLSSQYHLSPAIVGLVFLAVPGFYAFAAPMWGWIVDRTPRLNTTFICAGYVVAGLAFYLMGPAPFLPIPHVLWLVVVSLCLVGLGIGTLVITFHVIAQATLAAGYAQGLATYGLVAGIFSSCFSFGAFVGPVVGGYLYGIFKFEMSAVIIGSWSLFSALLLLVYILATSKCQKNNNLSAANDHRVQPTSVGASEKQPLLSHQHCSRQLSYNPEQQISQRYAQSPIIDDSKSTLAGDI